MAQYYTDFSEYEDTAALLAEWTANYNATGPTLTLVSNAAFIGGKAAQIASSVTTQEMFTWDAVPSSGDMEVLIGKRGGIALTRHALLRFSGTEIANAKYYYTGMTGADFRTFRVLDGTVLELGRSEETYNSTDLFWIRFRAEGSAIKVRVWNDSISEPALWSVEFTDSNIASGLAGFGITRSTSWDVDVFSVGTNGDAAPTGPVITGPNITSTTKLQAGKALTVTGVDYSATGNTLRISPTNSTADVAAVDQTLNTQSITQLTVTSVVLPAGASPGDTMYLFVQDDLLEWGSVGRATLVADPALQVTLLDTDSGMPKNIVTYATVLAVAPADRTTVVATLSAQQTSATGVLTLKDAALTIDELTDSYDIVGWNADGTDRFHATGTLVDLNDA